MEQALEESLKMLENINDININEAIKKSLDSVIEQEEEK